MYAHHFDGPIGGPWRHHHGHHGHRHGPWGSHRHGGSPLLPFLAGVFLARAMLRGKHRRFGGRRGRGGPWGWGGWAPDAREEWKGGPPWRRGDWGEGRERARATMRALRPEVAGIVSSLRDAWRGGTLDERKVGEIRDVLADTRRRIAAILSESQPPHTMV